MYKKFLSTLLFNINIKFIVNLSNNIMYEQIKLNDDNFFSKNLEPLNE